MGQIAGSLVGSSLCSALLTSWMVPVLFNSEDTESQPLIGQSTGQFPPSLSPSDMSSEELEVFLDLIHLLILVEYEFLA